MKAETVLKLWDERWGPLDKSERGHFLEDPAVVALSLFTMKVVAEAFDKHVQPFDALPHAEWLASGEPVEERLCICDFWSEFPGHHLNVTWNGVTCVGNCQCGEWQGNAGSEDVMYAEWLPHAKPHELTSS